MDFSLCPYKNLIGKPDTGVHKYKILHISVFNTLVVVIFSYMISRYYNEDFKLVFFASLLLGIIIHRLFCVRTTVDKLIFR